MSTDSEVLIQTLLRERQAARRSKFAWAAWTVLLSACVGVWFSGYQARKYYALGVEAGVMSTAEGRLSREMNSTSHIECDQQGRNCVNR